MAALRVAGAAIWPLRPSGLHTDNRLRRVLAGMTLFVALSACDLRTAALAPTAPNRPDSGGGAAETEKSASARAYYAQIQQSLLAQGLLRTDGGGPDTPIEPRTLAANFLRIALYDEYDRSAQGTVQRQTQSRLRRWQDPVRVGLRFGASVPVQLQATERARVSSYLRRLSALTGHPISLNDRTPNFWVHMVSEDEREALGPTLAAALPGLNAADIAGVTNMPRTTYCLVYATSSGTSGVYNRAFAVIRAEHPDLLRLSCLHEEIAQGLGLANDSPRARPSIFNDDEEFALLTRQDELMLQMLYDPLLQPGMSEVQASPVVETLASRLLGGES